MTFKNNVFITDIRQETINNINYRRVINTSQNQQLVLMSLKPNEDIELEIHPDNDQFIRIEQGRAIAFIGSNKENHYELSAGMCIVVPAGTWHQIVNSSNTEYLKLYTIYSPPHHPIGQIDKIRPQTGGLKNQLSNSDLNNLKKYYKYKYKYEHLKNQL
ncbi:mannose-6p isomerase [Cotonvirus japonicus]|uniref:Mannose-6p isomerase n=1 Tax=Cotonvirus japonicus TaxID=2811091 RepID=A0ABM7NTH3_9VIRU|nr:mannose-6p isomerase [Cotonvirus japonicus]BCS83429.1 mannose-6p isomerase [Cotonvirus japonicus]